jgi:hypothetical protein
MTMLGGQTLRRLEQLEELMGAHDDGEKLLLQIVFHNPDGSTENGPLIEIHSMERENSHERIQQ